ncbi:MAG: DUF1365 domain-containing protein [Planctomycetota bacterium]
MTLASAIYFGHVRHRRPSPRHAFTFPLFMVYLDLAELDKVFSLTKWWGRSSWCPARFKREDYLSRDGQGLDQSVRACVQQQLGFLPSGPIRMLTNLRYFGFSFNPVTFYYCFDQQGRIAAIVSEITNTPWGERHGYVLDARAARHGAGMHATLRWRFAKDFHVSPFLPMDLDYDWTLTPPGRRLIVHMNVEDRQCDKTFDAALVLKRRELSPGLLRSVLLRYPLLTARIVARIHLEALKLWLKRAPVFFHPERTPAKVPEGRAR